MAEIANLYGYPDWHSYDDDRLYAHHEYDERITKAGKGWSVVGRPQWYETLKYAVMSVEARKNHPPVVVLADRSSLTEEREDELFEQYQEFMESTSPMAHSCAFSSIRDFDSFLVKFVGLPTL